MPRYHREWDVQCKVYIGNLGSSASKYEIENAFVKYGPLRNVWVARNPPGFAFVEFEDRRDAEDATRGLDGTRCCGTRIRVEMSSGRSRRDDRRRGSGGGGSSGRSRYRAICTTSTTTSFSFNNNIFTNHCSSSNSNSNYYYHHNKDTAPTTAINCITFANTTATTTMSGLKRFRLTKALFKSYRHPIEILFPP